MKAEAKISVYWSGHLTRLSFDEAIPSGTARMTFEGERKPRRVLGRG